MNAQRKISLTVSISTLLAIKCYLCDGEYNSGCNDPYNSNSSMYTTSQFNKYCAVGSKDFFLWHNRNRLFFLQKVTYGKRIQRIAGGRYCSPGIRSDDSIVYCCSDGDFCNGVTHRWTSDRLVLFFILLLFIIKNWSILSEKLVFSFVWQSWTVKRSSILKIHLRKILFSQYLHSVFIREKFSILFLLFDERSSEIQQSWRWLMN